MRFARTRSRYQLHAVWHMHCSEYRVPFALRLWGCACSSVSCMRAWATCMTTCLHVRLLSALPSGSPLAWCERQSQLGSGTSLSDGTTCYAQRLNCVACSLIPGEASAERACGCSGTGPTQEGWQLVDQLATSSSVMDALDHVELLSGSGG